MCFFAIVRFEVFPEGWKLWILEVVLVRGWARVSYEIVEIFIICVILLILMMICLSDN